MNPESRGPRSFEAHPVSPVEIRGQETEFESILQEVLEAERQLPERVHTAIAERLKREDKRVVPSWARKALALSMLFGMETAEARERKEEEVQLLDRSLEIDELDSYSGPAEGEYREVFERYFEDENHNSAEVFVQVQVAQSDGKKAANTAVVDFYNPEIKSAFQEGQPIIFDGVVTEFSLLQKIPLDKAPDTSGPGWSRELSETSQSAVLMYKDAYGNSVSTVISMRHDDPLHVSRFDIVEPFVRLKQDVHGTEVVPLKFDLSRSGGHETFASQVFYKPPEAQREIVDGITFTTLDLDRDALADIKPDQMRAIEKGVKNAESLFADPDSIQAIYVRQSEAENASMDIRRGYIELLGGLLKISQDDPGVLEEVIEHEAFHALEYKYGLSWNTDMTALWVRTDPAVLREFNEKAFGKWGGHAQDDPLEFMASILNNLDHEQWLDRVQEMSAEGQEVYQEALRIAAEQLASREDLSPKAPIHALLKERRAELESSHE